MNAVSLRISGGSAPNRWPIRCWCWTSTSKLPTRTIEPSPRMLSRPRENSPALHVALHDVDAVLLVEGHARHLVEAHDVVLANEAALSVRHVDEHPRDRRLAARDEMRVGRDLLKQVALAGAARPQFHHVVVALDERDHAQQVDIARSLAQRRRFEPDAAQQQVLPLGRGQAPAGPRRSCRECRASRAGSRAASAPRTAGRPSPARSPRRSRDRPRCRSRRSASARAR